MNFRFTIGKKIGTGFGVFILVTIVVFLFTDNVLTKSRKINDEINEVYTPSVAALEELKNTILRSKMFIKVWGLIQSREDIQEKKALQVLHNEEFPNQRKKLEELSRDWESRDQERMQEIFGEIDELFKMHHEIQEALPNFASYDEAINLFLTSTMVEEGGDIDTKTESILEKLNMLIELQQKTTKSISDDMVRGFDLLKIMVRYFGAALIITGIFIAIFTAKSITKPLKKLKKTLLALGRGVFLNEKLDVSNDEVGEMTLALNGLIEGLRRTTQFSKEVGAGNFETSYKPLSDEDQLGHALLKMRDDLGENERLLEQKVIQRTEEVVKQKEEIEKQRERLEELYKDVTDSIRYAKRLQQSILPTESLVKKMLPHSFVLFYPKDIVSGDFYWVEKHEEKVLFAAVDCTGHGVPGAFMSLVGHNALNHAVKEHGLIVPGKILDDLDKQAGETLNKGNEDAFTRDGMDVALCCLDKKKMQLEYAGAYNPLYVVRKGQILETKPDKFPIGDLKARRRKFTNHKLELEKGDAIYIFSDGYRDQFGGPRGKKFTYKRFRELLLSMQGMQMDQQKEVLAATIQKWKGTLEQVDDILVIGVKV